MKKVLSFVLCLVMVFSLFPAFGMSAAAASDPVLVKQTTKDTADDALHMQKSLYKNEDGTYDIVIESWATGTVESHVVTEAVPTDFVLILDQSGSMDTADMPATYNSVAGPWTPNRVNGGTYYYQDTNTGKYYRVVCKDIPTSGYQSLTNPRVANFGENNTNETAAVYNNREVYYRDPNDGAIYRVYRETDQFLWRHTSTFYYYDSLGNRYTIETEFWREAFGIVTHNDSLDSPNYIYLTGSHAYGLYYVDDNDVQHQVEGSTTVSGTGNTFYSGDLYTTSGQMQTRLEALKNAVSGFVSTVQAKASADSVNHRIAIVGFASDGTNYNQSRWENTELLTGVNVSNKVGRLYNNISDTDYRNALQDVTTTAGRTDLNNAINAIDSEGGTQGQYGFYMAENILEKRTVTTYVNKSGEPANRNTVVLYFTDGHPGNFDTDDTIAAANTVVAAAQPVKQNQWNTKVFSVGIFAEGDDQPLTFTLTRRGNEDEIERENYVRATSSDLYFRGNKATQTPYNDTIADYMTVVSSVYPNAGNFLTHAGGTSDTGSKANNRGAENQDHVAYYMRVTDASSLQQAFEAVANSVDTSSTSATVDSSAVLRDTVYTSDFDVSGASVEAKSVKVQMQDGQVVETGEAGTANPTVTESVQTNGRLTVTNFDYSALYTSSSHPGEKLVVTIKNIEPKKGGHLWSNSGDASIFPGADSSDAVLGVSSPDDNVARIAEVIDFNAPMIFASSVKRWKAVNEITNGEYKISGGDFTYQLLPDQAMPAANKGKIDLVMNGVDTALAWGDNVESNELEWTQYTAIPAGSVYFDDDLLNGDAIAVGDGSGYNEEVTTAVSSGAAELNPDDSKVVYFTFKGTGVDIYCTTSEDCGSVQVSLALGDEFVNANKVYFEDPDGKYVLTDSGYVLANADTPADATRYSSSSYAVINKSNTTRYNVPTVTFTNLPYGEYTVYLKAMKPSEDGSGFKLDGVRVYNPLGAPDTYSQQTYKDNGADQESNARFYTLRDGLVNDGQDVSVDATAVDQTTGVLFVDNVASLSMKNGDGEDFYPNVAAAYKANSPKNEIYLDKDQAIALTVSDAAKGDHYWIGLSVPDEGADGATVNVNGKSFDVTSAVDMYYPITVGDNGAITVTNTGDSLISVTKLKVTSAYDASAVTSGKFIEAPNAAEPFGLITDDLLEMLIGTMAPVDQQVEESLPEALKDIIKQILSEFVRVLFENVAKLFGN